MISQTANDALRAVVAMAPRGGGLCTLRGMADVTAPLRDLPVHGLALHLMPWASLRMLPGVFTTSVVDARGGDRARSARGRRAPGE